MKKYLICILFIFLIFACCPVSYIYAVDSSNLEIYSPYVLLIEANSGKILYEKNAYEKRYPASTTKMMTALLTLENCDLSEEVEVSYEAVSSVPYGYIDSKLQVGEKLTVEQLLHVLLIPSANDAAYVLGEHIAGSMESFCTMMNARAVELGCKNTNFVNGSGIHNENHYSTAYDLSLIAREVIKNEQYINISTKTSYTLPKTNKYDKEDRTFTTTNSLLRSSSMYYYDGCNGIKTGYTDSAGNCIVAGAKRNGIQLIAVILGSDDTSTGLTAKYLDAKTLFDFGFNNYTQKNIAFQDQIIKNITIPNASQETKDLGLFPKDNISIFIERGSSDDISPQISLKEGLKAPITAGETVGTISYTVDGSVYTTELIASSNVEESKLVTYIFYGLIILFLAYRFIRLFISKPSKKNKRKRNKRTRHK